MFRIALCDDKKEFLKQEFTMAKDYLTSKGELCDIKMFTSGTGVIWLRNNCDALRELTERGVATEELFSKASALNRMIRNGKTDDASVEIQFDALSMILFYTKEFREKLTTEELSVIMESNQVLWSVDMYGSDPV